MSKRFLATLLTLVIIAIAAAVAITLAKGYRFSSDDKILHGTGILSITSIPDQASVYLDDHLTIATNANINSLTPKDYKVKIVKEGYVPWEKNITVKEGLVFQIKAVLFRAIPSVYPLTYSGAQNLLVSPDGQKLVYAIPPQPDGGATNAKKGGVWIWRMSDQAIDFGRNNEPHQVALSSSGLDFTKAKFRWSPDSKQILATFSDRELLIDEDRLNDPPRDITAIVGPTVKGWDEEELSAKAARVGTIKDLVLKKSASQSAFLKWSPDETKLIYSQDGKDKFKVVDIAQNKSYDLPAGSNYSWFSDSNHVVLVESSQPAKTEKEKAASQSGEQNKQFPQGKISIVEFDGSNKAEIYAGVFDPESVFVWPDGSRLVVVSTFAIATASQPNLYGINLK